jgi:hypothetical protein
MMRKLILIAVLFLFSGKIFAQDKTYITGNIFDNEQRTLNLQGVSVQNLSTHTLVQSDKNGYYALPAKKGDLIAYSMMGYHTDTVYLINLFPKNIYLRQALTELPAVTIASTKLSPYLDTRDPNAKPARRVDFSKERGGLRFNLGYGKYRREQEKERALEEDAEINEEISKNFNRQSIEKLVHYTADDIDGYIGLYRPNKEEVKAERPFNYSYYIASTFQEWKQLPPEARRLPPLPKLKIDQK